MLKKIIFFSLLACAAALAFAFNKFFFAESALAEPAELRQDQEEQVRTTAKDIAAAIREKYKINDAFLLISKESFTLLYVGDTQIQEFSCAIGKNQGQKTVAGDMKTPIGVFCIDEIIDASSWTHDFGDGKGEIQGAYGPWFISLDTNNLSKGQWGGIGIHGTHDPGSIGKRASEGCIRLKNDDVAALKKLVRVGMKVVIEE